MSRLIEIKSGIPFAQSENVHVKIDNLLGIQQIVLIHNPGAFGGGAGGSLIANAVFDNIRVFIHGKETISLIGDVDTKKVPYAIQLIRQANKLRNKTEDTAEMFIINFNKGIKPGHNAYVDFRFNSIANINDGDRTTYTGATIDVMLDTSDVGGNQSQLRNCGKIPFGDKSGRLAEFINPTEFGYRAINLMCLIEDDGTPSNSAIDKLLLLKGANIIREGSIPKLQGLAKAQFSVALDTGFVWIPINQAIGASQLKLIAEIASAGTNVEVHWMLTSLK